MAEARIDIECVQREVFKVTIRGIGPPRTMLAERDITGLLEVDVGECSSEEEAWRVRVLAARLAEAGERFRVVRIRPGPRVSTTERERAIAELRRRGYTVTISSDDKTTVRCSPGALVPPSDLTGRAAGYGPVSVDVLDTNVNDPRTPL